MLSARGIEKVYPRGKATELRILRGLSLELGEGDAVCIVGPSGAGKSTFLHILGTLDKPTAGKVFYRGIDLFTQNDQALAKFRNEKLGFVFQFHHLLGEFTALENVMLPGRLAGWSTRQAKARAEELLDFLGVRSRLAHYPSELSGGEQQRVAIARALACRPELLLADEPTGNLDSENSRKIQDLFFELRTQFRLTLVVVSHDTQFAARFPRSLRIEDGRWAV